MPTRPARTLLFDACRSCFRQEEQVFSLFSQVPIICSSGAAARKKSDRAWIEAMGYAPLDIGALSGGLGDFELIVNTVPAPVLPEPLLRELRPGTLLLELASAPGGFDPAAAEGLGLRVLRAPGLPGKTAPRTAAELLRESVYNIVEERHG